MFVPSDSKQSLIDSADPALQMRMSVAMVASEDRQGWTGKAKSQRLQELLEIRERLDAEILRATGDWDRDRAWEIDGALSPRAWLAHRTPLSCAALADADQLRGGYCLQAEVGQIPKAASPK